MSPIATSEHLKRWPPTLFSPVVVAMTPAFVGLLPRYRDAKSHAFWRETEVAPPPHISQYVMRAF